MDKDNKLKDIDLFKLNDMIFFSSLVVLIVINMFIIKYIIEKRFFTITIIFTFFIPSLLMYTTYIHHHRNIIKMDYDSHLKKIKKEIESEHQLINTIGLLLFGLGALYTGYSKADYLGPTTPYFLLALVFGYILPLAIEYIVIERNTLKRYFMIEEIEIMLIIISLGFLSVTLFIPLYMNAFKMKK